MFPFVSETNYLVIKARARNELYRQESYIDWGPLGGERERQQDGGWPYGSKGTVGFLLNGENAERMRWNERVEVRCTRTGCILPYVCVHRWTSLPSDKNWTAAILIVNAPFRFFVLISNVLYIENIVFCKHQLSAFFPRWFSSCCHGENNRL